MRRIEKTAIRCASERIHCKLGSSVRHTGTIHFPSHFDNAPLSFKKPALPEWSLVTNFPKLE